MLAFLRRGQRWLTAAMVLSLGGVFIFFMGIGGPLSGPAGGAVIEVGPYRFGIREFEQERELREQRLRETLGDAYDARAMAETLNQLTARALLERALFAVDAEAQGLDVAKAEIERSVLEVGAFRDEGGRFDREAFSDWVQWNYGSERNFMREQRMRLLAGKLQHLLASSASVSDAEARQSLRQRLEEIRIGFVRLDAGAGAAPAGAADEAAVAELLATREEEARRRYAERESEYNTPEQVRARHILFAVDRDAPQPEVEKARGEAEAARRRLAEGEDFAALAQELSDDAGTRERGGDLGSFGRGRMVKPFEEAAFALGPGAASEPVRSDFGFHVIRVEERQEARERPFEAVREEIARELLAREAARRAARERAERVAARVAGGEALEAAVRAEELTLERSGWLRRRPDGFVPGLGAAQDLLATAFTLSPGGSSPRIFEVGDRLALVQSLERREPAAPELDAQLAAERARLLAQKRNAYFETWLEARRAELAQAGQLAMDLSAVRR